MPFATGPWHTPPQLPDDPDELCLVLLFRRGAHYRYAAMRHRGAWYHQGGEALDPEEWVSRWAYITSSVEHLHELPPEPSLPTGSRLFVAGALTPHEQQLLLTAYVRELKGEVAQLQQALAQAREERPDAAHWRGRLNAVDHERRAQLASRDARIAEQRTKLQELNETVQRLHAQAGKAADLRALLAERDRTLHEQQQALASLKKELDRLRTQPKPNAHTMDLQQQLAARDRKIHHQRTTIVHLEQLVERLKEQRARRSAEDHDR